MADDKGRLTVEEAAEVIGDVRAGYVGELAKQGRIAGERVQEGSVRRWRHDPESVAAFREEWQERRRSRFEIGRAKPRQRRAERQEPTEWKIVRLPAVRRPEPPPLPENATFDLTPTGLVTDVTLAAVLGRHVDTVRKAVRQGERVPENVSYSSARGQTTYTFTPEEGRHWLRARRRLAEARSVSGEAYREAREELMAR